MSSTSSSVLVLGARGRFGLAATRAFAQAGWKVYAPGAAWRERPGIAGVQWLAAQPGDTAALAAAARGAEVVVQGLSPAYTHKAWAAEMPGLTQAADRRQPQARRHLAAARQRLQLRRSDAARAAREHAAAAHHLQGPHACRQRAADPRGDAGRPHESRGHPRGRLLWQQHGFVAGPGDGQGAAARQVHLPRRAGCAHHLGLSAGHGAQLRQDRASSGIGCRRSRRCISAAISSRGRTGPMQWLLSRGNRAG